MKTIAHVVHQMGYAGAKVLTASLSRKLGDRFRFVFIWLDEIGELGQKRLHEDIVVARRLRQAVRQLNVDLLHALLLCGAIAAP